MARGRPPGAVVERDATDDGASPVTVLRPPGESDRSRNQGWARGATAVHLLSLPVAAAVILWFGRHQWFFGDEWDFIESRVHGGIRILFVPHNEHWSTAPILIYRALYGAFGLRSYVPYLVVLVAVHLMVTHLLWRIMRRSGVPPVIATGLAVVFSVLGAGGENLLWAFQMSFIGAVAVGLVHLLVVDHPGPFGRRDMGGWLLAVLALMFSGVGVTMTLTTGLAVLLRRGVKAAVLTVVPPAAVYLVWLRWLGDEGLASHERTLDSVLLVPQYVWTGLSHALEAAIGIPAAGTALLVLVLVWLVRQPVVRGATAAVPTAMALGAVLLFVVVGVGRSALGVEQATASRYVYIAVALLIPTLGRMLADVSLGLVSRQLVVVGFLALALVHNLSELRRESRSQSAIELPVRAQIMAAAALERADAELVGSMPEPKWSPNLTMEGLARLERDDALPDVAFGETDTLAAATQLQLAPVEGPLPPVEPSLRPAVTVSEGIVPEGPECAALRPASGAPPQAQVRVSAPSWIAVQSPTGGDLEITLRSPTDPAVAGPPRTFTLVPAAPIWLRVSRVTTLDVRVPGAPGVQLCGVQLG